MTDRKTETKLDVNTNTVSAILNIISGKCDIECYEGVLLDNYIIYDTEFVKIGNYKPSKFIIMREKYLNEWNSITELVLTNNEKTVEKFISAFQEFKEEGEE